jgi:hypothetical protein
MRLFMHLGSDWHAIEVSQLLYVMVEPTYHRRVAQATFGNYIYLPVRMLLAPSVYFRYYSLLANKLIFTT